MAAVPVVNNLLAQRTFFSYNQIIKKCKQI